jgi:MerR family mercuric resistance operon transcriptional regulator
MAGKGGFSIGALAKRSGVHLETIRYYERIGLIPLPARTEGRHRLYQPAHSERLIFIRRCRELGFSLEEIRTLLGLAEGGESTCRKVKTVTLKHLDAIRCKIEDLQKLESVLAKLSAQCDQGRIEGCPVIDALFDRGPGEYK